MDLDRVGLDGFLKEVRALGGVPFHQSRGVWMKTCLEERFSQRQRESLSVALQLAHASWKKLLGTFSFRLNLVVLWGDESFLLLLSQGWRGLWSQ